MISMIDKDATVVGATTGKYDVTVNMDANFVEDEDCDEDDSVAPASTVEDAVENSGNIDVSVELIPWDVTVPNLGYAETLDADGDGFVDHIRLVFDEFINDASLLGYDGVGININSAIAEHFTVVGYTVVGLNMLDDDDDGEDDNGAKEAATAAALANADIADIVALDFEGQVINILDHANDNELFLMVQENTAGADTDSAGTGDTATVPLVSIVSGAATGAQIRDRYISYYAGDTDVQTYDAAAPAIMGAKMTSETEMEFWLSEDADKDQNTILDEDWDVDGSSPTIDDIIWEVGTAHAWWNSRIKDIDQITDYHIKVTVTDDGDIPAGNVGRIALGIQQIEDPPDRLRLENDGTIWLDDDDDDEDLDIYNVQGMGGGDSDAGGVTTTTQWIDVTPYGVGGDGAGDGALVAPSDLAIADVPDDNGHWVYATFTPSTSSSVSSYQFYREVAFEVVVDTVTTTENRWVLSAVVAKPSAGAVSNGKVTVFVPSILDGLTNWSIAASTGAIVSDMGAVLKEADIPVAMLVDDAEKAASEVSALSEPAVGGSIDNIAPSLLTAFSADDNDGVGAGVLISWVAPEDHGLVGTYGNAYPIYGVDKYTVYRKEIGTDTFAEIGFSGSLSTSYIDTIEDAVTIYEYYVIASDSNPEHDVTTETLAAMAYAGGADYTSDGVVGLGDLVLFGNQWGAKAGDLGFVTAFDMNADGSVGLGDLVLLGDAWTIASKVAKALPTNNDVAMEMSAEYDETSAIYYVNVNVSEVEDFNGVGFTMSYDTEALELVQDGIVGLGVVNVTRELEAGMIDVNSYFRANEFNGSISVAFKSKGMNKDLDFELVNASVSIDNAISKVSELAKITVDAIPTIYTLAQNYPNPFNPTTTIEYSIPQSGHVELVIYNMAGQKVRTLVSETQSASYKKVIWDSRNDMGETVGNGLYFYKLVSGSFSKIQKMTLIK